MSSRELVSCLCNFPYETHLLSPYKNTVNGYLFAHSDTERKDLQLSEDQSRATKPGLSLTSSQDHCKHLKTKPIKMKTKLRAAPYPEVGLHLAY